MSEEQIFKNRFSEYCVGEKCLSPYFDLFQIGFEEGENQNKELQALHKEIVDIQNECVSKLQIEIKQLQEENTRLKKESEEQLDKAREILRGLYFIIQSRINYENNTGIADEMWRAKQFLNGVSE